MADLPTAIIEEGPFEAWCDIHRKTCLVIVYLLDDGERVVEHYEMGVPKECLLRSNDD